VASTERPRKSSPRKTTYLVPDWVRVRRESFGLLFYDTRSTRLTFVRSGDGLEPPPFTGPERVLRVVSSTDGQSPAIGHLLERLVTRGLICGSEAE
jgi:putative mycofactocin binding protein MftB